MPKKPFRCMSITCREQRPLNDVQFLEQGSTNCPHCSKKALMALNEVHLLVEHENGLIPRSHLGEKPWKIACKPVDYKLPMVALAKPINLTTEISATTCHECLKSLDLEQPPEPTPMPESESPPTE